MYETIQQAASGMSLEQCALGVLISLFAIQRLGAWTSGKQTWWKSVLNLAYLAAILALFFFVYGVAVHALS